MSFRDHIRILKPREETYTAPVEKIQSFFTEEVKLPPEVFDGFTHEINSKKSSSKRTIITVKSGDRDNDRDEILRRLKQIGVVASLGSTSSSVDPIDGMYDGENYRIEVKPLSGGMQETTLNSSITELFPCIAFETNYTPVGAEEFMTYLMKTNLSKMKCINPKDIKAAEETINKAESSSKFQEKMKNAIGITKYLKDANVTKPIRNVYWGYRAKPKGVPSNHPGDMFIEYNDGKFLGVSLKAGGKKTKEPQLNTYVRPVFEFFKGKRDLDTLRSTAYSQVYSKIKGMPALANFDGGEKGRHKDRRITEKVLKDFDRTNSKEYESGYDTMLEIMRKGIINLFNKNKDNSLTYIKSQILRDAPEVPTIVIKAVGSDYEEVTDRDELGVFLPQVKFVKAYPSTRSKQNWTIELSSNDEKVKMGMSIRSNKPGHAGKRKLGQFPTGLAVKYNGIEK